jgi:hypothetical protein
MKTRSILLILFGLVCATWLLRTLVATAPEGVSPKTQGNVAAYSQIQPTPALPVAPSNEPEEPLIAKPVPPSPALVAENAISKILITSTSDHAAAARRLTALVLDPNFPAAQRSEALSHVLNLSAGHESEILLPLVRDPRLAALDCRAVLDDALNQSAAWQGEVYLAALGARPEPELRARIRTHLSFLTGREDLGDDPKAWLDPLTQAAEKASP